MANCRNGEGKLTHYTGSEVRKVSDEKCECGMAKFEDQKVCGTCSLKKMVENVEK